MVHTRGQQAGAVSPANPSSSAADDDSFASPGIKNGVAKAFLGGQDDRTAYQMNTQRIRLSGNSTSGNSASGNSARAEILERSSRIGTHVGVSTYPDDPLNIQTDTDESADEHHTRYGVDTNIRGDNGVFGTSGARAGAPAVLLSAYQGA